MTTIARLHVVIPAYHEEKSIHQVLNELNDQVHVPMRVSLVCDSRDDPTFTAAMAVVPRVKYSVTCVLNAFGTGALNAIKTGLKLSEPNEAALIVMADGCDELAIVDKMWARIVEGYGVVCGSRYMRGGRQIGGWWFKKLLSRSAGISFHILTGIGTHDITNSFKMYSPEVLQTVQIESIGGFEVGMELTIKAFRRGYRVAEIPTTWTDRTAGVSRFNLSKWLPRYLRWYWKGLQPRSTSKRSL